MKANSKTIIAAVGVLLFGLAWMVAYPHWAMPDVRPHSGDGRFENHSFRFPWSYLGMPIPGYTIDFPQFDLSSDFAATYRLEKLPELPDRVGIYLSIYDPADIWFGENRRKTLAADVQIDIHDDEGNLVCHVEQPLAKMIWTLPEGGSKCFGLYNLESFFIPRTGARYIISVRYTPDSKLSGFKGFFHIRCGGSI